MLIGASRLCLYLAEMLLSNGVKVKIIEKDEARATLFSELLPRASLITADGAEEEVLLEEGLTDMDAVVTLNGQTIEFKDFCSDLTPKFAKGELPEMAALAPLVAAVASELILAGNTIINCTVPAAVAAAMGIATPEEAAPQAEKGAYITIGIPGGKASALAIAKMAKKMADRMA